MIRAILFFVKLALLVAVAVWLVEHPGLVRVDWQGYRLETSFGILVLMLLALAVLLYVLVRFYGSVLKAPFTFMRARNERKRRQGYLALTQGMVAVAAGDPEEAKRLARKADSLLEDPPLTMLLSAQAAQLNGDDDAAERYFTAMLKRPETEFLGLRGLLNAAVRKQDSAKALTLVKRAHEIRPQTDWVLRTLFDLQVKDARWTEALSTVQEMAQGKLLSVEAANRHRAALQTERAREAAGKGDTAEALDRAKRALGHKADFVPAALEKARLLIEGGKHKRAAKLVESVWAVRPHPGLAALYERCWPGESALQRMRRFQSLAALNPQAVDSHVAVAKAALDAQLWGEARGQLDKAMVAGASANAYRLMASVVESEYGDVAKTRDWLAKAAAAPADPVWICGNCGAQAERWHAVCGHCGAFDSQEWRLPPRAEPLALPAIDGETAPDQRPSPVILPPAARQAAPEVTPPRPD
ncbi:heme biosynthesis protein HemY [Oceanibaculum indicum]|uniref:Putative enzyme of heme biosynthesis (HemY-like) protein n=1 Tax=Oceanibaculum indicum P24 TaxID=1207063 RepID=K2JNN5_9PROT|nr:heme biosynthesis HemY N-terminal domain-containing protein [Oceanibaculum indicum]EKE76898.1 putative enzyme of heme biosynthesis (HemY-like) protein [Oceanibaculum indicum P24]